MRFLRPILYMMFMGAACTGTSEYHKRVPGFTGVRGKRSVQGTQDEMTGGGTGGRGSDAETEKHAKDTALVIQKRAPPELSEGDEGKPFNGWIQDNSFPEGIFKRAPSAFFGMRGKKYFYDEWPDKRARTQPSGFFGMRGKKLLELPSPLDNHPYGDHFYPEAKRIPPAGFMGMRGKKLFGDDESLVDGDDDFPEEKRAHSASFYGMRGKKEDTEDMMLMSEAEKRARNLFFGMRGRRDLASGNKEITENKRAYNAFFGMRGKRDYENYLDDPSIHALYGMRGKKHRSRSNIFGMRGKKLPHEFRGKFVGVRGKKSTTEENLNASEGETSGMELERVSSNDLGNMMFLLDDDKNNNKNFDEDYDMLRQNSDVE